MRLFKIHTEENGKDVDFGIHGVYSDNEKDAIKYVETEIATDFLSMRCRVKTKRTSKYSIIYVWDDEDVKYRRIIIWAIEIENYGKVEEIIKALEGKPCIDAVSRQAVLNTLDFADKALDEDRTVETYKELLIACYKDLPSVAHTQKLRRWIFVDKAHEHARCSECGYGNVDLLDGKPHNFCPNCGSFMMDDEQTLECADQDVMMPAT